MERHNRGIVGSDVTRWRFDWVAGSLLNRQSSKQEHCGERHLFVYLKVKAQEKPVVVTAKIKWNTTLDPFKGELEEGSRYNSLCVQ